MADTGEHKPEPTPVAATEETTTTESTTTEPSTTEPKEKGTISATDDKFSMFGGGPTKPKKVERDDEEDEPSGSSKAKKEEQDVCTHSLWLSSLCERD
jgi:Ran-binding protein 1